MRWCEIITESADASQIGMMIADILMSVKSQGVSSIPTSAIQQEIMKRYNIDVEYGELMSVITELPMVQDATEEMITLTSGDNIEDDGTLSDTRDPQSIVADMAMGTNVN